MKTGYFYGNNIIAASFIIQLVSVGALFTYGVFFKEFHAEFGWSRAMISGASSVNYLVGGLFAILSGRLNDRIGPKVLIVSSGIFLGLGYFFMSWMTSILHLYLLYGITIGLGICTIDVITLSTVARWFIRKRGMMSGVIKVGTGLGQIIVPLIAVFLIANYGWRNAYIIISVAIFLILVSVAQVLRRDPQSMGLLPDNDLNNASVDGVDSREKGLTPKEAIFTWQFWIMCLSWFAVFFCVLTIPVHIVPYARDLGVAPATAAGTLSMIGGVSILGRIVMGTANDRLGGKRSLIICFMILICALVCLQFSNKVWMLFLFAAIYGFSHGGLFTVISPTVAELFGTSSHGELFGIILFSGTIGGSIGPLMAGAIFDNTGSYQLAFFILTVVVALGLVLLGLLKPLREN